MAADFGSPIVSPQGSDFAGSALKTLSGVLGLKQQQQSLQTGAAQLQQEQQTAQQRAGIAKFFQDYDLTQHVGADGTINLDDALTNPQLRSAAGDKFPEVIGQLLNVKQNQLAAKQSLVNLNDTTRKQFGDVLGGLRDDPDVVAGNDVGKQKASLALGQWAATSPEAAKAAQIYGPALENTPPNKLRQAISNVQLQAMDASTQAGRQAPTLLGTGAKFVNVNPQAAGGSQFEKGGGLAAEVGPGVSIFEDQAGNKWAVNPQNPGQAIRVGQGGTLPGTAPQSVPSTRQSATAEFTRRVRGGEQPTKELWDEVVGALHGGRDPINATLGVAQPGEKPPVMGVGEADVLKTNTQNVTQTRQAAADSQAQLDILNRIRGLSASPGLYTGKGSQQVADIANAVSKLPGMEKAAEYANNYNELTKFMAQNAARMGKSLGLEGSDSRLDLVMHASPNAAMDTRTIGNVADYLSGIVRMGASKADALDNWLQKPGNSLRNEHEFEKQWRDAADPRLFQLHEMTTDEAAKDYSRLHIKKGEQDELAKKYQTLKDLGVFK